MNILINCKDILKNGKIIKLKKTKARTVLDSAIEEFANTCFDTENSKNNFYSQLCNEIKSKKELKEGVLAFGLEWVEE